MVKILRQYACVIAWLLNQIDFKKSVCLISMQNGSVEVLHPKLMEAEVSVEAARLELKIAS